MYKLSIGSLLVVLVTLQQQHTAAAMSLAEHFEQLILNLDTKEEQPQNEDYEVCISYNQIQDIIRSFFKCKNSPCSASLHTLVEELLQSKKACNTASDCLDIYIPTDVSTNSSPKSKESIYFLTKKSNRYLYSDSRERIMALNCILLI